jgi:cell envelope opacity-associated protein A
MMQITKWFALGALCLPSVGFAQLTNKVDIQMRQDQTQVQMVQLLEAVQGLTPSEVEEAVRPIVTDTSIMAHTAVVATAAIAALAATNQRMTESYPMALTPVCENQFDIKF